MMDNWMHVSAQSEQSPEGTGAEDVGTATGAAVGASVGLGPEDITKLSD